MKRAWLLLAFLAACSDPPKPNVAAYSANDLRDIYSWHPQRGAEGQYAYDAMFATEPTDSVPILISRLNDSTPTAIDDRLHDPVTVGTVAFHILMRLFSMKPDDFENEGVWVMKSDPSGNPIYTVKFKDEETPAHLAARFHALAIEREWIKP